MSSESGFNIETGVLKFTNHEKGFSFIKSDWPGPDVFAHSSSFRVAGIDPALLNPMGGERVAYEVQQRQKGSSAFNIRLLRDGECSMMFPLSKPKADEPKS